jgi:hypothetical protein
VPAEAIAEDLLGLQFGEAALEWSASCCLVIRYQERRDAHLGVLLTSSVLLESQWGRGAREPRRAKVGSLASEGARRGRIRRAATRSEPSSIAWLTAVGSGAGEGNRRERKRERGAMVTVDERGIADRALAATVGCAAGHSHSRPRRPDRLPAQAHKPQAAVTALSGARQEEEVAVCSSLTC